MPTTISGTLSTIATAGLINNVNGNQVSILDDVIVSNNAVLDCTLHCKTLRLGTGVTFGSNDANGNLSNRTIIYTYGNLQGWDGFASLGHPGRAIIKTNGISTIRNVTFIFKGGAGTEVLQGSVNWDGLPPYYNFSWGFDGSTFQDLDDLAQPVTLENVEFIHPDTFASNTGFWSTGAEVNFKLSQFTNVYVRNIYGVIFTSNPTVATGLKVINSAWGVVARETDLSLTALVSDNVAVQQNSIFTLIDCQVLKIRWKKENSNRTRAGFSFKRTFEFSLQGQNASVRVDCFSGTESLHNATSNAQGATPSVIIEWGYLHMNSANVFDDENINATTNKLTYDELIPSKFMRYKLPLDFIFSGYGVIKQTTRISTINFTLSSILTPQRFIPVMIADTDVTDSQAVAAAYTTISNLSQLYDAIKNYSVANPLYPSNDLSPAYRDGQTLNLRNMNLVIDKTAAIAIAVNQGTNTITIKSDSLIGSAKFTSLKTTGNITLQNGAIADIPYQDASGILFKFIGLPENARIRITRVSNSAVYYASAGVDGVATISLPVADYIARADGFLYYRSSDIPFNSSSQSLRLTLTPYRDKDGVVITSINPVMAEVDLISVEYSTTQVFVTYSATHPTISTDSLLYALEKFQSGYNPTIPGSLDDGLNIENPIVYQNEQFVAATNTTVKFLGHSSNPVSSRPYLRVEIVHLGYETPWRLFDSSNGRFIELPSGQVIAPVITMSGGFESSDRVKLLAIPTNPLLTTDSRLANLNAPISSVLAGVGGVATTLGTVSTTVTNLGIAIAGIPGEVAELPVEVGWPFIRTIRMMATVLGGTTSGTPDNTTFNRLSSSLPGLVAQINEVGNRETINYSLD